MQIRAQGKVIGEVPVTQRKAVVAYCVEHGIRYTALNWYNETKKVQVDRLDLETDAAHVRAMLREQSKEG